MFISPKSNMIDNETDMFHNVMSLVDTRYIKFKYIIFSEIYVLIFMDNNTRFKLI